LSFRFKLNECQYADAYNTFLVRVVIAFLFRLQTINKNNNMIKRTFIIAALGLFVQLQSFASEVSSDTLTNFPPNMEHEMICTIEPTFLKDVVAPSAWSSNWFIGISGGTSAFLGKPLGCEDIFGRMKPSLSLSFGKWFTPEVGGRIAYQGFQFKDCNLETKDYRFAHADFLWNMSTSFSNNKIDRRWNIIPYAGAGIIHHEDNGNVPFAFSYGMITQYRLSKRALVSLEVGGMTTFQNFDGDGKTNRFGDNMLSVSLGITYHIGKVGFKRVVDASPYITQNKWLTDYTNDMLHQNQLLCSRHEKDSRAIAELQKILEIEGLMDFYGDQLASIDDGETIKGYPKNDYSGLNSLRARLSHRDWDGNEPHKKHTRKDGYNKQMTDNDSTRIDGYISDILKGKTCVGAPVHFFFKLGSTELTDVAQAINIDEIVRVVKKHDLKVKVIGSADSATGTTVVNDNLSLSRATFISKELQTRGVDSDVIL
jgi:outer membrane protein OmpA-like peptidoglycan-associated protein